MELLVLLLGGKKHFDQSNLIHIKVLLHRLRSCLLSLQLPPHIDVLGELVEIDFLIKIHVSYLNIYYTKVRKFIGLCKYS